MEDEERLYYAIDSNDVGTLRLLLKDVGVSPKTIYTGNCPMGTPSTWSALHLCCEKGRYECAKMLLEEGADPDVQDKYSQTPLSYSIQTEWLNLIELLIKTGADIHYQDRKGRSLMHVALECSDIRPMQILLDAGAHVDERDTLGRTPLWLAASRDGHAEKLDFLLAAGCDVNKQDIRETNTPLQAAICHTLTDTKVNVRKLLEAKTDVNLRDGRNRTALMSLIHRHWVQGKEVGDEVLDIARSLLAEDYRVNDKVASRQWNQYSGTVLQLAVEKGATALVDILLQWGADPNIADDVNNGPLLMAVRYNRQDLAKALLYHNCLTDEVGQVKLNSLTIFQHSPLQCALHFKHLDMAKLLVDAGCSLQSEAYLWTNHEVPEELVLNCDMWAWLRDQATNPRTLLDICIFTTRKALGIEIGTRVELLPVPPQMRNLILLKTVLGREQKT